MGWLINRRHKLLSCRSRNLYLGSLVCLFVCLFVCLLIFIDFILRVESRGPVRMFMSWIISLIWTLKHLHCYLLSDVLKKKPKVLGGTAGNERLLTLLIRWMTVLIMHVSRRLLRTPIRFLWILHTCFLFVAEESLMLNYHISFRTAPLSWEMRTGLFPVYPQTEQLLQNEPRSKNITAM